MEKLKKYKYTNDLQLLRSRLILAFMDFIKSEHPGEFAIKNIKKLFREHSKEDIKRDFAKVIAYFDSDYSKSVKRTPISDADMARAKKAVSEIAKSVWKKGRRK